MFASDILKMLYSPRKVLKTIVENPKYWGAFLVLLLFIGLQVAFQYAQYSKNYFELTYPDFGTTSEWNSNATLWTPAAGVNISNNYDDYVNYTIYLGSPYYAYYSVFGNSSLQFDATDSNHLSMSIQNGTVDCGPSGFRNLTMAIKLVQPQTAPEKATLTLYCSNSSDNYFQYDLTSDFAAPSADAWTNITIPVGPDASAWHSTGSTDWSGVTSVSLDFTFANSSNITVRVGDLFFRGLYRTATESNSGTVIFNGLYLYASQFIFEWLLLSAIMYILIKVFKGNLTWKPLFTATGFALAVLVVRSLIYLAATATLPNVYYPYDLAVGVSNFPFGTLTYPGNAVSLLSAQAQASYNHIADVTLVFQSITEFATAITYAWLGALCAMIIQVLVPEFSFGKRVSIVIASLLVTLLLLLLVLVGVI